MIRYTAGIVDWTIPELENLDSKTRKLMTDHPTLHPQRDNDTLYLREELGKRTPADLRDTREETKEP